MATGLSLRVGLNGVGPARYEGREGAVAHVTAVLREPAARLVPGGIPLFGYSGHGGQVPDATGSGDESTRSTRPSSSTTARSSTARSSGPPPSGSDGPGKQRRQGGTTSPCHSQGIAQGGPCGKAPHVPQNLRSKQGTGENGA